MTSAMTKGYFIAGQPVSDVVEARARATPPAGPVVWVAKDKKGRLWLYDSEPTYFPDTGGWAAHTRAFGGGSALPDFSAALGLAPGACQRVRLVPEGETP